MKDAPEIEPCEMLGVTYCFAVLLFFGFVSASTTDESNCLNHVEKLESDYQNCVDNMGYQTGEFETDRELCDFLDKMIDNCTGIYRSCFGRKGFR